MQRPFPIRRRILAAISTTLALSLLVILFVSFARPIVFVRWGIEPTLPFGDGILVGGTVVIHDFRAIARGPNIAWAHAGVDIQRTWCSYLGMEDQTLAARRWSATNVTWTYLVFPFWISLLLVAIVALYPAYLGAGCWKTYRRRRAGRCVQCGYNLTGNTSGRCPECGTET